MKEIKWVNIFNKTLYEKCLDKFGDYMGDERLVPKLRFSGFNDDWIKVNIKNYSTIKGRIGWKNLKQSEYTESGPYLIAGKHIYNGIINWEECDHLSMERYDESPEIALKIGDVIFSKDGSLGNPALIRELPDKATINGTMMLVRLHEKITPNFFYQVLNSDSFFRLLHILKSGSSIPHIFQRYMENFNFNVPQEINEQNKISNFLEAIDEKIKLLEMKYELYQNFKKFFMQQIFAQELRFDDNCQYKSKKVKDFLTESKIEGIDDIDKRLTVKLNLKGITVRESKTIEIEGATKQFIRKSGQFIYGKQNLHKGAFGIVPKELDGYLTSSDIPSFDFKGEIEPKWFYYYFSRKSFYERLESLSTGTGSKRISPKEFLNIKIIVPEIKEQHRIVCLLAKIDEEINGISNQILQMNRFKKSLLQQMFV